MTKVYKLKPYLGGTSGCGFSFGKLPALVRSHTRKHDFTHFYPETRNYSIPRLGAIWDSPDMQDQEGVSPEEDYPCADFHVPVFSFRAMNVLRDFLEPNGEILPLTTKFRKYYAYQTLTIADGVFNSSKSEGDLRDDIDTTDGLYSDIDKYEFFGSKIKAYQIFRLREEPSPVLVTSQFKERAEANGLNGMHFIPIWPHPSRADIILAEEKQKTHVTEVDGKTKKLQGETILLRFSMGHAGQGRRDGNDQLHSDVDLVIRQISDRLVLRSGKGKYFGSIEDYQITLDRGCTLVLSCPAASQLSKKLETEFSNLEWWSNAAIEYIKKPFWKLSSY